MLFKSLGVAIATNTSSNSDDDLKAVTIRLTDSEIQLYDTVAKSMGLTRQIFYHTLFVLTSDKLLRNLLLVIRVQILLCLCLFCLIHTENPEIRLKLSNLLTFISQELMEEDEKDINEQIENHMSYSYATPRKGIFVEKPKSEEN